MDPLTLTASDILGGVAPESVFGASNKVDAEPTFKALRRKWHPDRNSDKDATAVFCKLQELYDRLGEYLSYISDGVSYTFKQKLKTTFLLGEVYHHEAGLGIVVTDTSYTDVFLRNLKKVKEGCKSLKELQELIPELHRVSDDKTTIVLKINKGSVNLGLLMKHQGGKLEPRVVAWIISRMFNWAMMMQTAGLINNAFSPEHFWVETTKHTGFDPLSLFFATMPGEKLKVLTGEGVDALPSEARKNKVSDPVIDVRLIKKAGIRALGDHSGSGMALVSPTGDKDGIPRKLVDWLRNPVPSDATILDVYQEWQRIVLPDVFAKRSFYKWEISASSVFTEEK